MIFTIPDNLLQETKLDERTLTIEFACHLFNVGHLTLAQAAGLVGLSRTAFEDELHDRRIPVYRMTLDDYALDREALAHMRRES